MSLMDYPNREALGLDPPWVDAAEAQPQAQAQAAPDEAGGLEAMTKAELLDYARERGISPANEAMNKDEIRASIDEHEAS